MKAFQLAQDVPTYGERAGWWIVTTDDGESEIAGPFPTEADAQAVASLVPFDDYEVHGCADFDAKGKKLPKGVRPVEKGFTEQVDDADASFFSLYGHTTGQGVECIGDFKTRAAAEAVRAQILAPLKQAAALMHRQRLNYLTNADAVQLESEVHAFTQKWF